MASVKNASEDPDRAGSIQSDLALVKSITAGSIPDWHEFIHRYSGLIYSVVRKHLLTDDEDEIRGAWADILKALYEGELAKYRGEARLSTWLIVSTRSRTIDLVRKSHGRIRRPQGYETLSDFDKRVLQLFYVDRLPLEIIVQALGWGRAPSSVDAIVESVQRIERTIDRRYLDRLDDEFQARKAGVPGAQVLRYLIRLESDLGVNPAGTMPDDPFLEGEILEKAGRLRRALSSLPPRERQVLLLRYGRGWSARKIADGLRLKGPRRVYGIIDRAIERLRKAFLGEKR